MKYWKQNLIVCWLGSFVTAAGLSQIAPILPLYIQHLGITDVGEIERWSGIAFGITFIVMAIASPLWGQAADKYGRKPMLLRASMGMAVVIVSMGFVQTVSQLVVLRFIQGAVSGYISAAIIMVATQAPKEHTGWAMGTLSTGAVGGMLLGPLFAGYVAEVWGIRSVFLGTGGLLLLAFGATLFFIREEFVISDEKALGFFEGWRLIPKPQILVTLFVSTFILQIALLSIEPIITVYVTQIAQGSDHVIFLAGMVFAASGFASMLTASYLGNLSDKIGPQKVMLVALIGAGIIFIPQAYVTDVWQLMGLRFMLGIAVAGLLPSINTLVKRNTPDVVAGRVFGYNQSAQFLGSFFGSVFGGQVAASFGIHYVFFLTSGFLLLNAVWVYVTLCRQQLG